MAAKRQQPSVEVSSDQLMGELTEIKERVGALENVAGLVNRAAIQTHVKESLASKQRRTIMRECEQPRTREHLMEKLGARTPQALDYHLTPLRQESLIHVAYDSEGTQTFEWSNLVKRIPRPTLLAMIAKDE